MRADYSCLNTLHYIIIAPHLEPGGGWPGPVMGSQGGDGKFDGGRKSGWGVGQVLSVGVGMGMESSKRKRRSFLVKNCRRRQRSKGIPYFREKGVVFGEKKCPCKETACPRPYF